MPWGILIFFGGSLSLSAALAETGVTRWLSQELQLLHAVPVWLVMIVAVALIVAVSEMMSNSATITAFLPILAGLAGGLGIHPFLIMIPATLPYMFTGYRLSLGIAWLVIVAVEMLTGRIGIGNFLWNEYNNGLYTSIVLCIVTIGLVGFFLDRAMSLLERRFKSIL